MKSRKYILCCIFLLSACADPARNFYDGVKINNDAKRSPAERATSPTPSYDQYKKERESETKK